MGNRHYIVIEENGNEVYKKHFLGNNNYADQEFYDNLNLSLDEDGYLEKTEVDFRRFFVEWFRFLVWTRNFSKMGEDLSNELCLSGGDKAIMEGLMGWSMNPVYQFFSVLNDCKKFSDGFDLTKLESGFKMFIEIC